ncbi:MAG TPA: alpha/beta fold hydrolase [Vicinamibacteria bacterium]|nr:alpha/beta fold hydrolase [Vicinamibacteria bacterium]
MSPAVGGDPPSDPAARGAWRRPWLARLAFYPIALLGGLPLVLSEVLIRGSSRPASPPPPGYAEGRVVSEGLRLRTWRASGSGDRPAVVVVHGLGDTLESYVDRADVLRRRGHAVLLLDLRAHGASEGRYTTLGGREREDVRAAMAAMREGGGAAKGFVLLGHSMGAVAVLRAAASEDDVRAVVAEAPYDTYRATVTHHAWLLYRMPSWFPVIPLTVALAEWRAGFDADEVDAVAASAAFRAPLLAIVDGDDPRMPVDVVRRIVEAHPGPSRLWVAAGVPHVGAVLHPDYWPTVLSFLESAGV